MSSRYVLLLSGAAPPPTQPVIFGFGEENTIGTIT